MSDSVRPHRQQPTRFPHTWDSPGKNIGVGCHFLLQCMKVKSESEVLQSCPTLSDPMDCSLPGSSIHGIFQARVLEWVASASSDWVHSKHEIGEGKKKGRYGAREKGLRKEVKRGRRLRKGEREGGKTVDWAIELTISKWYKKLKEINSSHRDLM